MGEDEDMGGANAQIEVDEGARTGVELAMLGEDGPTGRGTFIWGRPWHGEAAG